MKQTFHIGHNYLIRANGGRILFGTYRGELRGVHAIGGVLVQFMPGLFADGDPVDVLAEFPAIGPTETGARWCKRVGIPESWPS